MRPARPRQFSGNASEQKFTQNVLLIDDTVRLTTKSQKSAYEEAKNNATALMSNHHETTKTDI